MYGFLKVSIVNPGHLLRVCACQNRKNTQPTNLLGFLLGRLGERGHNLAVLRRGHGRWTDLRVIIVIAIAKALFEE